MTNKTKLEDRIICPGCGKENPKSQVPTWFICTNCTWESEEPPKIRSILRGDWRECDDVNLRAFLKTLLEKLK